MEGFGGVEARNGGRGCSGGRSGAKIDDGVGRGGEGGRGHGEGDGGGVDLGAGVAVFALCGMLLSVEVGIGLGRFLDGPGLRAIEGRSAVEYGRRRRGTGGCFICLCFVEGDAGVEVVRVWNGTVRGMVRTYCWSTVLG